MEERQRLIIDITPSFWVFFVVLFCFFRKPRPVSQLVAQQVNQQFPPPTHPKKEKKEKSEKDKSDKEPTLKKKGYKKMR